MSATHKKSLKKIKSDLSRTVISGVLVLVVFLATGIFFLKNIYLQTRAAPEIVINNTVLNSASEVDQDNKTTQFLIESKRGQSLFKLPNRELSTVLSTLDRGVTYQEKPGEQAENLLPETVLKNTILKRTVDDKKDKFLEKRGFKLTDNHFIFEQRIGNIPVLGSSLTMHVEADNAVSRMSANLLSDESVPQAKLSDEEAKKFALEEAKKDSSNPDNLEVHSANRSIINKKLLGIAEDPINYLALGVNINDKGAVTFAHRYYIDLLSGQVVYSEPLSLDALNRDVSDCSNISAAGDCAIGRLEGQAPVNRGNVDAAYEQYGQIYNFFQTKFSRDSYNNKGAKLEIGVNMKTTAGYQCPNASWFMAPYSFWLFCQGMVVNDVSAHEFTHAMVEHTAGLSNTNQGGALNEGLSDIFGYAFEPTNWTIGETSAVGVIRSLDDPTRPRQIDGQRSPDRLFSNHYYCGVNQGAITHINNGVLNKAFYLMVSGGSFNDCQMAGQGLDKILPIFYRALTVYLTPTANYRSMYDAINLACHDLYTSTSAACSTVKSAMQATEMDQQPAQVQLGPKCQNIQPLAPACRSSVVPGPTVTPGPSPSPGPTGSVIVPTAGVTPTNTKNATGTYTDLQWPAAPTGGFQHVGNSLTIENFPAGNTGYLWGHEFKFIGGDGGYLGLKTRGHRPDGSTGKVAVFTIWKSISAESDGIARPFSGDEGEGYEAILPYEWVAGKKYDLNIMFLNSTNTEHRWAAWVHDLAENKFDIIGIIGVPLEWRTLSGNTTLFTERYSGPLILSCQDVEYARAVFSNSRIEFVELPISRQNRLEEPASCSNSKITNIQDGVRHEIGIPENQIIPTNEPYIEPTSGSRPVPTATPAAPKPITTIGRPAPTATPVPTATPAPTATPVPTAVPTRAPSPTESPNKNVDLNLQLRFQGIAAAPKKSNSIEVKVTLAGGELASGSAKTAKMTADGKGLWQGVAAFDSVPIKGEYHVLIKGQKHVQKKICELSPAETTPGTYNCNEGKITLKAGPNELKFSSILIMAGDLSPQDGVINSVDLVKIKNLVGKTDAESLKTADVNLDGIVDTQDFSLAIASISRQFNDD